MKGLIEKIFTESMRDYPYDWAGDFSGGCVNRYCDINGFVLHGPHKGDLVFKNWNDNSPAFEVTYANNKTKRIRVKKTDYSIQYNNVLRDYLSKHSGEGIHPTGSRVLLVKGVNNGS